VSCGAGSSGGRSTVFRRSPPVPSCSGEREGRKKCLGSGFSCLLAARETHEKHRPHGSLACGKETLAHFTKGRGKGNKCRGYPGTAWELAPSEKNSYETILA